MDITQQLHYTCEPTQNAYTIQYLFHRQQLTIMLSNSCIIMIEAKLLFLFFRLIQFLLYTLGMFIDLLVLFICLAYSMTYRRYLISICFLKMKDICQHKYNHLLQTDNVNWPVSLSLNINLDFVLNNWPTNSGKSILRSRFTFPFYFVSCETVLFYQDTLGAFYYIMILNIINAMVWQHLISALTNCSFIHYSFVNVCRPIIYDIHVRPDHIRQNALDYVTGQHVPYKYTLYMTYAYNSNINLYPLTIVLLNHYIYLKHNCNVVSTKTIKWFNLILTYKLYLLYTYWCILCAINNIFLHFTQYILILLCNSSTYLN